VGAQAPGLKGPGRESDRLPTFSAEGNCLYSHICIRSVAFDSLKEPVDVANMLLVGQARIHNSIRSKLGWLFSNVYRPFLEPTQNPVQWVPRLSPQGYSSRRAKPITNLYLVPKLITPEAVNSITALSP